MPQNDLIIQLFDLVGLPAPIRLIATLKVLSAIASIILGWAVFLLIFKSGYTSYVKTNIKLLKSEYEPLKTKKGKVTKEWEKIARRLEIEDEASYKLAIIEADKLVDNLLKDMNYAGESMGDRLKMIDESKLKNINELWEAHKARNNIVHDANFKLSYREAQRIIETYENVLREFEALD